MTEQPSAVEGTGLAPAARLEPNAIGVAQDTVIGMASSAPAATIGLSLAALAAATAYGSGPILVLTAITRAIRRALRDDPPGPPRGGQPAQPQRDNQDDNAGEGPGGGPVAVDGAATVERDNEGADHRHPPEAPDDYADARGWVGYT